MKPKVLVVDDDQEFVQLLEFNLEREGCEIFTATTAVQALHMARSTLPDVILLDLMLPDMDGFSVCEILHSQPSTREIPVIVLSGLDWSWANTRKHKARIAQYFKKPVELNSVVEGVRAATQQRQAFLKSWVAEQRD
jgi:DNA-binding response OmpR family regulator